MKLQDALSFDDVLLVPSYSQTMPAQTKLATKFSRNIQLNIPIVSAAMDTVTGSAMAIAMAQLGGIGVIHKNLSPAEQAQKVAAVKRNESGMVVDPITIHPEQALAEALALMREHKISGIPVVSARKRRLLGILTNRDVRFVDDLTVKVKDLMTRRNLVTVQSCVAPDEAKRLFHQHRIEKLLVIDEQRRCIGLITVKDLEKTSNFPQANRDEQGRLRVAAAIGVGDKELERAQLLIEAGVDALVIDTAHGHTKAVLEQLKSAQQIAAGVDIAVGNVATADAARMLVDAGADAVKIGIGPGSICTTRIVTGVGVAQFSAVLNAAAICQQAGVPAIADGGIKCSGDLAKALAAGAHSVMLGSLLAGVDEAPGEVFLYQGRTYKSYRGMGSAGAMAQGSADRYFQEQSGASQKFVPEGVEGRVPHKGALADIVYQLTGGLRSALGYTGCPDIATLQQQAEFCRVTGAGMRESHVHDITITRESPNYSS